MKIFVAMSGGVDSATCLYLLKKQNYNVSGLTLKLDDNYDAPIKRSQELCHRLGVSHIVLDYRDVFQKEIIENFNEQIRHNLTPVPCINCNRKIKIGKLLDYCVENNAKLATGHYAKIKENHIYRAKDTLKDQTHFLCNLKKENIKHLIFPLGDYLKSEVFRIATEEQLFDISAYKESQDVCFFENKTYNEYIKSLKIFEVDGDIIHIESNKKLGKHTGLLKYTIGQRQGLGVAWSQPLYVVKKDTTHNILYVGEEQFLYSTTLKIKDVNFLVDSVEAKNNFQCKVCLRDKTPLLDAVIYYDKLTNTANVELLQPARAITSGQWCVMYLNDMLVGGGLIC